MAYVNTSSSFRTLDKYYGDDGAAFLNAIVGSGIDGDTPVRVAINESGYFATALAASLYGYVGISAQGSIASGCIGSIQIEGYHEGVQTSAAAMTGVAGGPVIWAGTSLHATSTATALGLNSGNDGQVGILTETVSASTTANMFLFGYWTTPSL